MESENSMAPPKEKVVATVRFDVQLVRPDSQEEIAALNNQKMMGLPVRIDNTDMMAEQVVEAVCNTISAKLGENQEVDTVIFLCPLPKQHRQR